MKTGEMQVGSGTRRVFRHQPVWSSLTWYPKIWLVHLKSDINLMKLKGAEVSGAPEVEIQVFGSGQGYDGPWS